MGIRLNHVPRSLSVGQIHQIEQHQLTQNVPLREISHRGLKNDEHGNESDTNCTYSSYHDCKENKVLNDQTCGIAAANNKHLDEANKCKTSKKIQTFSIASSTEVEVEVYVRGRGRGRYVCERCGIRCKKPSMLKKHLKSHTDHRPFTCNTCSFSFKTKGNLTKHLLSKAHLRRLGEGLNKNNSETPEEESRLVVVEDEEEEDEDTAKITKLEKLFATEQVDDDEEDEEEMMIMINNEQPTPRHGWHYGQENVLLERQTHTPPTIWGLYPNAKNWVANYETRSVRDTNKSPTDELDDEIAEMRCWPSPQNLRRCNSAPPVGLCSPENSRHQHAPQCSIARNSMALIKDEMNELNSTSPLTPLFASSSSNNSLTLTNFIPLSKPEPIAKMDFHSLCEIQSQDPLQQSSQKFEPLKFSPFFHNSQYRMNIDDNSMETSSDFLLGVKQDCVTDIATLGAFLAAETKLFICSDCNIKFRKESDFDIHKQTHLIEQKQQNKQLNKLRHGRQSIAAESNVPSQLNPLRNNQSPTHSRIFACEDCNIKFRTHGVLAKHLRSKNHIKSLVSQGKLPDEASALLAKEYSRELGSIEASDTEQARKSIIGLLIKIREHSRSSLLSQNDFEHTSTWATISGNSLECSEHLSTSPDPQSATHTHEPLERHRSNPLRMTASYHHRIIEPLPHGLKRKCMTDEPSLNEASINSNTCSRRNSTSSQGNANKIRRKEEHVSVTNPLPQQLPHLFPQQSTSTNQYQRKFTPPTSILPIQSVERKVTPSQLLASSTTINELHGSQSPLHSLAQIASQVAAAEADAINFRRTDNFSPLIKSSVTSIWIPPKLNELPEKLDVPDPVEKSGFSNDSNDIYRSGESESTGTRSESSTPIQRCSLSRFSPMSGSIGSTRCQLCDMNFDTPTELSVHFHSYHIVMRHGQNFKCPRKNCEKICLSRESLRVHVSTHFFGLGNSGNLNNEARTDDSLNRTLLSPSPSPSIFRRIINRGQSPNAQEESSTNVNSTTTSKYMQQRKASVDRNTKTTPESQILHPRTIYPESISKNVIHSLVQQQQFTQPLLCTFCNVSFRDTNELQSHWMAHHLARPHVCKECDAGFTTAEALKTHMLTHQQISRIASSK